MLAWRFPAVALVELAFVDEQPASAVATIASDAAAAAATRRRLMMRFTAHSSLSSLVVGVGATGHF
jgi:hypothetical protein